MAVAVRAVCVEMRRLLVGVRPGVRMGMDQLAVAVAVSSEMSIGQLHASIIAAVGF